MGVDACRKGWVVVALGTGAPTLHFIHAIDRVVDVVPDVTTLAIDIPIGLPERGRRESDTLARTMVGPRRSSVFAVPSREVLMTDDFEEANRKSVDLSGSGLSKQSHALRVKILEVDAWLTRAPCLVFEVHPEVSFRHMVGAPIAYSKKSWAGVSLRRKALLGVGIDVDAMVDHAGERAGVDDVLDAAAAAWSADRIARGVAESLPPRAPDHPPGAGQTIWF